jgi:hypothetical protein
VTGKLKTAIDAMVWAGARRPEAALLAGMTDHSLRAALKKPHVKQHYLAELGVLRESERARNIHALVDVRDTAENAMARVGAVKALEQLSEQADDRGRSVVGLQPGLIIEIVTGPVGRAEPRDVTPRPPAIDAVAEPVEPRVINASVIPAPFAPHAEPEPVEDPTIFRPPNPYR